MGLRAFVSSLDDVPEVLRDHYTKSDDGGFVLEVEDKGYKTKLDEFRSNNRTLHNSLKEMKTKFKDIDPEKYAEASKALEDLKALQEKDMIDAGKLDEVLEQRTETMRTNFENQVTELKTSLQSSNESSDLFKSKLSKKLREATILTAVGKVGVIREGAMADILSRAEGVFHADETGDNLVPLNTDGETIFNKEGNAMSPEDWAKDLIKTAVHLFESGGGGDSERKKVTTNQAGILDSPTAQEFGDNLVDIASGKVKVNMAAKIR